MATLEKRIYDATLAREVVENEAFQQAFEDIKQEYVTAWMNSPVRDPEGREKLYLMLKTLEKVKATFESTLADGKIARMDLDHEQKGIGDRIKDSLFGAK